MSIFCFFYGIHCVWLVQFLLADLACWHLELVKLHIWFWLRCWSVETEGEPCFWRSLGPKTPHSQWCLLHSQWCPLQEHGSGTTYLHFSSFNTVRPYNCFLQLSHLTHQMINLCTPCAGTCLFSRRRAWALVATYCLY